MFVRCFWSLLWVFGCVSVSLNEAQYESNCAENYDNEISNDQTEESPSAGPCREDAPRWDKLFTALEDSHMRQNMLISSVDQNCGGDFANIKTLWDKLTKGGGHLCAANMEKVCRTQAEQMHFKIRQEILDYSYEMERNFNLTLQQILYRIQETNTRLKRLEDSPKMPPHPTLGTTTSNSGLKEQEVDNQWLQNGSIGKRLIAIATQLHRIQHQLNEVIEETRGKDRGDT